MSAIIEILYENNLTITLLEICLIKVRLHQEMNHMKQLDPDVVIRLLKQDVTSES